MLRLQTQTGYYLITHSDHAHLAGRFAEHWGNDVFFAPTPRNNVLQGIHLHDDAWLSRDAAPSITRRGKPSAFSADLVGRYSAFEEIVLSDYLTARESAVENVEQLDPYAALLVCMHTYNLLTEHADRATIAPADLPILDAFLSRQRIRQQALHNAIRSDLSFTRPEVTTEAVFNNFRLLQACDHLSLLACVGYTKPSTLLHPLPTTLGPTPVAIEPIEERHFRLTPYPFDEPTLHFEVPARHVEGHHFDASTTLARAYNAAPIESLPLTFTS
jgi:hypothetical protein